jgi:hypothetical protein
MTDDATPTAPATDASTPASEPAATPAGGWREKLEHAEEALHEDIENAEHKFRDALHHASDAPPATTPAGSDPAPADGSDATA